MEDTEHDDIGRIFCKKHHRDYCHVCGFDFRDLNRVMEEEKGLRQKRSPVEEAAEMWAVCSYALLGMERMSSRPSEAVFEQNRHYLKEFEEKLRSFAEAGEDVETAKKRAMERQMASEVEQSAILQEMVRQNPGQRHFQMGGPASQKIYEQVAQAPKGKKGRADMFTCAFCGKTASEKLKMCSRCKMVSYCSRECQVEHWKVHKKECIESSKNPKSLPLTWEQVEAHRGAPVADGTLELKVMLDESMLRQVFSCKDRVGAVRRIAAYTDSRRIPGLKVGSTLRWKNPRFHYFADGSSGARIEEEDLLNITIKN